MAGKTGTAEIDIDARHQRPVVHRLHRRGRGRRDRRPPAGPGRHRRRPDRQARPPGAGASRCSDRARHASSTAATGSLKRLGIRRHGRGLVRRGRGARPPRRAQAARQRASPRTRSSASASGARRGPPPGSRTRTSSAIFDRAEWDGTPYIAMELVDGPHAQGARERARPLPPERRRRPHRADPARARLRAPARDRAPRRQAAERDHRPRGPAPRSPTSGSPAPATSEMTETGAIVGTVQYLSPEQAQGTPVDAPLGPLLDRRRALRAADRAACRSTARRRSRSRSSTSPSAPVPPRAAAARRSRRRSRPSCCARWRRTRRAATRAPTSSSPRSSRRAARRPRQVAPTAARARSSRSERRVALVGVGAGRCSRCSRSPSARTSCSRPSSVTVPERGRPRRRARPPRSCTNARLEVAFVNASSPTTSERDEVIAQDPAAGRRRAARARR